MKRFILFLFFAFLFVEAAAQQRFSLSGYIRDSENGEELIGVTVYVPASATGAVSNAYGFYSLTLPAGKYDLTFSSVGYRQKTVNVNLDQNKSLNVQLAPDIAEMQEIVITDRPIDENVTSIAMSRMKMDIDQVRKLPPLFGEPDIIKTIQLMPGVLIAGEGSGSYFVRGGNVDHNLILLDEAPVYDPSHMFGLVSVFNSSSIKNSELLKGGIPAQYGGRLASILDIRTKNGNDQDYGFEAGVGMLSSRILAEGPLIRNRSSFIVSGRRSYFDLMMPSDAILKPYFYDINAKINFELNENNTVFAAFYAGRDKITMLDGMFNMDWGNQTATVRWNHVFNKRLFWNTSVIFSDFDYQNIQDFPGFGVNWTSNLREFSLKEHFEYYINPKHTLFFGLNSSYRSFDPGRFVPTDSSSMIAKTRLDRQYALDNALYAGLKQELSPALTVEYGVRLSAFTQLGEADIYVYEQVDDPAQKVNAAILDTLKYDRFQPVKTYIRPEPRISALLTLGPASSLKFSYNRMVQYVHQLATGTSPLPIAIWQPSGYHIKPQIADQVAFGYFRNLENNMYESSVEIYYKYMKDIVDFRDNAQTFFNVHLPREILAGNSYAYGAEFLLRKARGPLNGWLSYTWSKAIRDVPGVNQNNTFLPTYDRRHNATLAATYDLSKRISIGGTWIYGTGRSQTLPKGTYVFNDQVIDYYTGRNEFKLRDFHRLDLSINLYSKEKPGRRLRSETNISLYNAYGRRNPFMVFTQAKDSDDITDVFDPGGAIKQEKEIRQVNMFGILPSISYTLKF